MNDLSSLADMAEIIGVIIVVGGLIFALLQMRQIRQQRRELAAIELFRFFGNPHFSAAYKRILHLPDDISAEEVQNGNDGLAGGPGDDLLNGGNNFDRCIGGAGNNIIQECELVGDTRDDFTNSTIACNLTNSTCP